MKLEGWPHCAVCNAPVKRMTQWAAPNRAATIFVAECHGASEETVVFDHDLQNAFSITADVAFAKPQIAGPK